MKEYIVLVPNNIKNKIITIKGILKKFKKAKSISKKSA